MLNINSISIKNFQSIGNVSQGVQFSQEDLTLVLGINQDLGGNDSRNGVGKSTILNAMSYALYGEAVVKIRKDNLINKVNGKQMLVSLDFEKDDIEYRIERGRKPNVLRFYQNGSEISDLDGDTDEAQGDSRDTQERIESIINMSREMFKEIVALTTNNSPFLSQRAGEQRQIIEELLGITKLSQKAEKLKANIKETKSLIAEEEFRISTINESNESTMKSIKTLKFKSKTWGENHEKKLLQYATSIVELENLDIESELIAHKNNASHHQTMSEYSQLKSELKVLSDDRTRTVRDKDKLEKRQGMAKQSICHACEQPIGQEKQEEVHLEIKKGIELADFKIKDLDKAIVDVQTRIDNHTITELRPTHYRDADSAYAHKQNLDTLMQLLEQEDNQEDPYIEQISMLEETGLKEIDKGKIDELIDLRNHQEFLLKLLVNKDSFIRKKIIDQNLSFLNARLSEHSETLGLPHRTEFMSDLEVDITHFSKEYDFDNLSRGEKTRLTLALSWAFRDVYESLNNRINLLFVDELIDNGLDPSGVESALAALKNMCREQSRNVFLISHRDELIGRVTNVLKVIKENDFTTMEYLDSQVI